jgi:pyruvate, orthophosphate dikinase
MVRYVYDVREGRRDMADLLGGKGANLAEMTRLGLPVPPGFTVTTDACRGFLATGAEPEGMSTEVSRHLSSLEETAGRRLGQRDDPLLVSVRSGARFSMPGMMETVLDIGLNDDSVLGLAKTSGSDRFAWDSYRRLVQMFGSTVMGVDTARFDEAMTLLKEAREAPDDLHLDGSDLAATPATGLHRHPGGDGRTARDDPPVGSAVARVPARPHRTRRTHRGSRGPR